VLEARLAAVAVAALEVPLDLPELVMAPVAAGVAETRRAGTAPMAMSRSSTGALTDGNF